VLVARRFYALGREIKFIALRDFAFVQPRGFFGLCESRVPATKAHRGPGPVQIGAGRSPPILLKKSVSANELIFSGALMRPPQNYVGHHVINPPSNVQAP
jgi:hypothetical protein